MTDVLHQGEGVLILTDHADFEIGLDETLCDSGLLSERQGVTQTTAPHTQPPDRPCLVILPGARVVFPAIEVLPDSSCLLTVGNAMPSAGSQGLEVEVWFRTEDPSEDLVIWCASVEEYCQGEVWREVTVDVAHLTGKRGRFVVACNPGRGEMSDGGLAVYEFVVGPNTDLRLNRARAFAELRTRNEIGIFSQTYEHSFYNGDERERARDGVFHSLAVKAGAFVAGVWERVAKSPADSGLPVPPPETCPAGESPGSPVVDLYQHYSSRLMQELGLGDVPFAEHLKRRLQTIPNRPIRILSLASGAARIEEGIIAGLDPRRIELTLTDINENLLRQAKARLDGKAKLRHRTLDLNQVSLRPASYDVILCVSALHHVVELERLLDEVATALVPAGEFWSIGEYIGRNGSRLSDAAYAVANGFFQSLPAKYRVNCNPGSSGCVDDDLPNFDCSVTCFEGIRSEELEALISRRFRPDDVIKFDCFLWRLFNLAYMDNYDLSRAVDQELVERAVGLELDFHRSGGQPSSMHGIFTVV